MRRAIFLAAAIGAFVLPVAHTEAANTPSFINASTRFYTNYELLSVRYVVGWDASCHKDEYGFWENYDCGDMEDNNAEWDVRVYQTRPSWKLVYAERNNGYRGKDDTRLYWSLDLRAPYQAKKGTRYNYKAVVRLFSPVSGRVLKTDAVTFGIVYG